MNFEMVLKTLSVLVAIVGAAKIIYELVLGGRGRLREEYKFGKEFLSALEENPKMHPFLKEKGYQAIAGDRRLSAVEVEYILSLQNSDRALSDYVLGRSYLEHLQVKGDLQLNFRPKYKSRMSRGWRKVVYFSTYFVLAFLAFSPILISKFLGGDLPKTFVVFGLSLVGFGPFALMALMAGARISRAERLVKNQSKHTQKIVLKDVASARL